MENYKGVKFSTNLSKKSINISEEITELVKWCKFYSDNDLAPTHDTGSFGNLSIRDKNGQICITSTGIDLGKVDPEKNIVKLIDCDFDNKIVLAEGQMYPSSESMLHYLIYKSRPEIKAVFHGHNTEICSKAIRYYKETATVEPYGTIELVNSAQPLINEDIFIIKNHGFFISGTSITNAGALSRKLLEIRK